MRSRPLVGDSILAGFVTAVSTALILILTPQALARWQETTPVDMRAPDAVSLTLAALCTVPLIWRRRWPFVLLLVTTVPAASLDAMHYNAGLASVAALILLYTVAAHRGLALSLVAMVCTALGYAVTFVVSGMDQSWADHIVATVLVLLCWVLGRSVRLRRAYLAELVDRADRLERARESDTRAARAEERSRIARELHDVVAHHVSVMTVQAAAARKMLEANPDAPPEPGTIINAREALTAIEEMGRTAMVEMRNIVGVLRTDGPAERGPQPGLHDLPTLVEQMREAGLRTQLWLEGERKVLPPGVDLAAYRLVQEALTNSLRHAGPAARAWVTVRQEPTELNVHVEDDGRGAAAELRAPAGASGHGLVGIRERVALYGGVLRIGPRNGGGFEVRARFPLKER
ncbi:sensor histidine kinase [Streptosporangiaceae bacterium NEAU-GS5]|nr:sensor histidine kinase [Streptosporangiaceae bacterium NEAU-GS5]